MAKSQTKTQKPKKKTSRKPKTLRVPRTRADGTWTEAGFFNFLRSGLRKLSQRWPVIRKIELEARRPSQSSNKLLKWEYQCAQCTLWFPRKQVQVDHIIDCGSLRSMADVTGFIERLFCERDGLRVLCSGCHTKRHDQSTAE